MNWGHSCKRSVSRWIPNTQLKNIPFVSSYLVYKYQKILMIQVSSNKTKNIKGFNSCCLSLWEDQLFGSWILHFTLKSHRMQWGKLSTFWVPLSFMSKVQVLGRHFSINSGLFFFLMVKPSDELASVEFRYCNPWGSLHWTSNVEIEVRTIGARLKEQKKIG